MTKCNNNNSVLALLMIGSLGTAACIANEDPEIAEEGYLELAADEYLGDYYESRVTLPSGLNAKDIFQVFAANPNDIGDAMFDFLNEFELQCSVVNVGCEYFIDILGPDDGAVVIGAASLSNPSAGWIRVDTISTPEAGTHPEDGWRLFGYETIWDGTVMFYTRGHSRGTSIFYNNPAARAVQALSWTGLIDGYRDYVWSTGGLFNGKRSYTWIEGDNNIPGLQAIRNSAPPYQF